VTAQGTAGSLPARLALAEVLGAEALVWLDCVGNRVSVRMSVAQARALPANVGLSVDISRASLFATDTGLRL
jgi:hypothetical protein